ncbi:unnamed protein product [Allacma fusca]|uniref:Uncharacterized protein n=1 Tax=Allacma fusca TaxID=39272 RepID=A0A8J2K931_9HEXA|nr:unnamed protein product [Allacma fusca]
MVRSEADIMYVANVGVSGADQVKTYCNPLTGTFTKLDGASPLNDLALVLITSDFLLLRILHWLSNELNMRSDVDRPQKGAGQTSLRKVFSHVTITNSWRLNVYLGCVYWAVRHVYASQRAIETTTN